MKNENMLVIFSDNGDIHLQDGKRQFTYSINGVEQAACEALAILDGADTSGWECADEELIVPTGIQNGAYRVWGADELADACDDTTEGWENVRQFREAVCAVQGINPRTGIAMFKVEGTITLSSDLSDYGPHATHEDVAAYKRYLEDHVNGAKVEMGAYFEAGWNALNDFDQDQEAGDEWLADMWARYPEHEAKYR